MRYDYRCGECSRVVVDDRSFETREMPLHCGCGGTMEYQFPLSAIKGFTPFESYYDEALGCDINGPREKAQILKAMGLVEAGDSIKGSRNFDKDAPDHIKSRPPKGVTFDDARQVSAEEKVSVATDSSLEATTKDWKPQREPQRVKTDSKGHIIKKQGK